MGVSQAPAGSMECFIFIRIDADFQRSHKEMITSSSLLIPVRVLKQNKFKNKFPKNTNRENATLTIGQSHLRMLTVYNMMNNDSHRMLTKTCWMNNHRNSQI